MPINLLEIYGDQYESTTISFLQHYLTIVLQIQQPKQSMFIFSRYEAKF